MDYLGNDHIAEMFNNLIQILTANGITITSASRCQPLAIYFVICDAVLAFSCDYGKYTLDWVDDLPEPQQTQIRAMLIGTGITAN